MKLRSMEYTAATATKAQKYFIFIIENGGFFSKTLNKNSMYIHVPAKM